MLKRAQIKTNNNQNRIKVSNSITLNFENNVEERYINSINLKTIMILKIKSSLQRLILKSKKSWKNRCAVWIISRSKYAKSYMAMPLPKIVTMEMQVTITINHSSIKQQLEVEINIKCNKWLVMQLILAMWIVREVKIHRYLTRVPVLWSTDSHRQLWN